MTAATKNHDARTQPDQVCRQGEHTIFYPGDREKSYWPGEMHDVVVKDIHSISDGERPTVAKNGFALLHHNTAGGW